MIRRARWSFQLVAKGREFFHWGAWQRRTGRRVKLSRASFHPKLQTRCSGETGGIIRLEAKRRRAIPDLQGLPLVCCFLSSSFLSFLRFTVSFSQKRVFVLKAGGSPAIVAAKTWQYLLKYGCGPGFFLFLLLYLR
jgi:hypothetical protein